MTERRYRDPEIRRILELATRPEAAARAQSVRPDGLTLAELQNIGLEVGVAPEAIARAATALDAAAARPRTSWGMPVEVARTVPLPRQLTDVEWERLVAELRATFRARGSIAVHGGLREWSNGNLHASVEPAEGGYRLRLGTLKGDAAGTNALGAFGVAMGGLVIGASALAGASPELAGGLMIGLPGAALLATNFLRLPRWARERTRQMAHIEATVRRILADASPEGPASR